MKPHFGQETVRRAATALAVLSILGCVSSCANRAGHDAHDEVAHPAAASRAPGTLAVVNGRTVLRLSAPAQRRLGIGILTLTASVARAERTAPATVLPVQDLLSFRDNYITARAQADIARAGSEVARKEYVRLKTLYGDNQEVSQKEVESAEGTLESDRARQQAAEAQLKLQADAVRERWGTVVSEWATGDSPELASVLDQREWFAQVTMPPGTTPAADPPAWVSLELPAGGRVTARFVSAAPQVDPRIQGLTYLYRSPAAPGISAGAALVAHFPVGKRMRGVIVPGAAVVWSEGQAWVYELQAPGQFVRHAISTDLPSQGGYFVAAGLAPGERIVVRGAQSLLSEELLLEGGTSGPGDENPD